LLDAARDERHHLVYLDEAHIHQDVDLGYGWAERGKRFDVVSSSPGLKAKVSPELRIRVEEIPNGSRI
jgi:hypothetical protein